MEEWLPLVKKSPLFYGINDDELYTLLKCCASEQVLYEDGEYIFRMGESVNKVLVLLRGKACVIQENFWGHQEHIYHIKEGELFGQSYSCARTPVLPVSVVAEGGCETLFLNYQRMITFCPLACDFHTRFIHNMLSMCAAGPPGKSFCPICQSRPWQKGAGILTYPITARSWLSISVWTGALCPAS